jgi:hypothetical protein
LQAHQVSHKYLREQEIGPNGGIDELRLAICGIVQEIPEILEGFSL